MLITARSLLRRRLSFASLLWLTVIQTAFAQTANFPAPPNNNLPRPQQSGSVQLPSTAPSVDVYQPVVPETRPSPPSSEVESLYMARLGAGMTRPPSQALTQFGYDVLGVPAAFSSAQLGGAPDNYVLGIGDEVVVVLRGSEDVTYTQRVNRDGQIILPKLTPIQALGRTLAQFRDDLERQILAAYTSTRAFVSLGEVRQISVLVTGRVRSPGLRILSAFASPLDAILVSGGIAKTGSLRSIAVMRGNRTRFIDLYPIVAQGDTAALGTLENGDRIFVPPLQDTVAVYGAVLQPGIFELSENQSDIDAAALVKLAGGYPLAGAHRLSKIAVESDGTTRLIPLGDGAQVRNGEILLVDTAVPVRNDTVQLRGAALSPNIYPLAQAKSVRELIHNTSELLPSAYTPFALLSRRELTLNTRKLIPFSLAQVLSGRMDIPLQNEDVVYVFTADEIRNLANTAADAQANSATRAPAAAITNRNPAALGTGGVAAQVPDTRVAAAANPNISPVTNASAPSAPGGNNTTAPRPPGEVSVALMTAEAAIRTEAATSKSPFADAAPELTDLQVTPEILGATVTENLVWLYDEIKQPGAYLAARGTTLAELVQMAGGPVETADLDAVEVTSTIPDRTAHTAKTIRTNYKMADGNFASVTVQPFDVVRFRPLFSDRDPGSITITGEVRFPGTYDIRRGEQISAVIARAGGLTEEAYPLGAIFTRKSAAVAEAEANAREARELESALAAAAQRGSLTGPASTSAGGAGTDLINNLIVELRTAPTLGRISITANPDQLTLHPELDTPVEGGDTLFIPKRPTSVAVTGEVLNPGSFTYRLDLQVQDYIMLAGGTRESADGDRVFVVLPDGSARPVEESWLTFDRRSFIPPGSTIVVPIEVAPFNWQTTLTSFAAITQVMSSLAITAASLAILKNQ